MFRSHAKEASARRAEEGRCDGGVISHENERAGATPLSFLHLPSALDSLTGNIHSVCSLPGLHSRLEVVLVLLLGGLGMEAAVHQNVAAAVARELDGRRRGHLSGDALFLLDDGRFSFISVAICHKSSELLI